METNAQFLDDLREELLTSQARRYAYVKLKLAFVYAILGLAGLGVYKFEKVEFAILLAPVIALVFDLYITSENYSVKRIGTFIRYAPAASKLPSIWEELVSDHRDPFTPIAAPLSTAISVLPGVFLLGFPEEGSMVLNIYIELSTLAVFMTIVFELVRQSSIKKFELAAEDKFKSDAGAT